GSWCRDMAWLPNPEVVRRCSWGVIGAGAPRVKEGLLTVQRAGLLRERGIEFPARGPCHAAGWSVRRARAPRPRKGRHKPDAGCVMSETSPTPADPLPLD